MPVLAFETLTAATQRARNRPANTIALILGLEGARYYVFFSQPDLGQLMNRVATQKVSVALEIEHHARNLAVDQLLRPSVIRSAQHQAIPQVHNDRRERATRLTPYLVNESQGRGIVQIAGHAEMFLIASWRECVQDFIFHRRHRPRQGEIFLTHSPCRDCDTNPSPEMLFDGIRYPESCRAKLYTFFKRNKSLRWKIWYALRFGSAEALDDAQLSQDFPGITIGRMPPHMLPMFT
jgi:hypothetical protein